jgi:hypothetical protein
MFKSREKIAITSPLKPKYGITEQKKAELDAFMSSVLATQHLVERDEAIVALLTQKPANLRGFLRLAQTNLRKPIRTRFW